MRVPDQAPALVRNHRAHPSRRFGGQGTGVSPSQYEGDDDGEGGEGTEEAGDEGGESGEDNGNEADASVENE
jgi:hypothetical protein